MTFLFKGKRHLNLNYLYFIFIVCTDGSSISHGGISYQRTGSGKYRSSSGALVPGSAMGAIFSSKFPSHQSFFLVISRRTNCNFSWRFLNPNFNFNCSKVLDLKNLQEQAQKAFCFNLYCWNKCPIDLIFANSQPSPWISKVFLNHYGFFLT